MTSPAAGQALPVDPDLPLLCLALGVVVLVGVALARRTGLPDPVVLVTVGLAASFLPNAPVLDLPPDVVFLVFLPPLLYRASFLTDLATLRRIATPLALLSVGLVLATAVAVAGVVAALVPGVSFAQGLVLGAVVAPTDPVAASGVFKRLGAPRFVVDLVEGESLINDATALVLFAVAVEAVVGGRPSVAHTAATLVLSVGGGVAVGTAIGALVLLSRTRLSDVGLQLLLTLFTPYAAYVLAERVDVSGVLAVVVAGLMLGSRGGVFTAAARLQSAAFWSLLDLVLNAVLFVLLGLQVRRVVGDTPQLGAHALALYAVAVVGTVAGVRVLWQFAVPPPVYGLRRLFGRPQASSSAAERLVIGWTGMRGAVSLAAALAIPRDVPERALLLFLTIAVVLATLVLQGTTLPLLLRLTGLSGDAGHEEQERQARTALAEVALARLDELEAQGDITADGAQPLRRVWEQALDRLAEDDDRMPDPEVDLVGLRLELARVQGEELDRLRGRDGLHPEVVRELQTELDLQRVRLSDRHG
ncbi:MAG: Na+/H+ antiporter [Frankiales bacterium]|nr:Na+/H+ antiporter [Frankiales bacterium]